MTVGFAGEDRYIFKKCRILSGIWVVPRKELSFRPNVGGRNFLYIREELL